MKNVIKLTLLFILFVGCNSKVKKEANVDNEDIEYLDLIGKFKRAELENHPFIKDSFNLNYKNYKAEKKILNNINSKQYKTFLRKKYIYQNYNGYLV